MSRSSSNQPPSEEPAPDSAKETAAPRPEAPPKRERADQDLFNFKTIGGSKPVDVDDLVAKMSEAQPILGELLRAPSEEEQVKIIQGKLTPDGYVRVLELLSVITFQYKEKAKRLDEALALTKLQYRLATMLPPDWSPRNPVDRSRTRYIADTLQDLGSVYLDRGEFSQALDFNLQAEEWYERDSKERAERGIVEESEFDRLFHERDVRAILFENTSNLYHQLGDYEKAKEYGRRMAEIDLRKPTNQSRIANLLNSGQGAEARGDFNSALGAFHQALDLALADSLSTVVVRDIVTASHYIGSLLAKLRLFRQALRYHQRALDLNSRAGHMERMSYDYRSIGEVLEARPDLGDAIASYQDAVMCASVPSAEGSSFTWQAPDGAYFRILDPYLAWPSTLAAARVLTKRGDYQQAEKFLKLTIELGEVMRSSVAQNEYRIGFQAHRMEAYQSMVKLQVQLSRQTPPDDGESRQHKTRAFVYGERARSRSFLDLLGTSSITLPNEVPEELRLKEAALAERLRSLREARPTSASEGHQTNWAAYETTRAELEDLWQEIVKLVPAAADHVELRRGAPIEMKDLRGLLVP